MAIHPFGPCRNVRRMPMQSPDDCVKQRRARTGILGGVPAFLLTLALGLLAFAPAAAAAPATCATDGVSPIAGTEGGLGQEFPVGPDGGDLHAYSVAAFSNDGQSQLSILPLDASGTPDLSAARPPTTPTPPRPPPPAARQPPGPRRRPDHGRARPARAPARGSLHRVPRPRDRRVLAALR